ncbi:hypothetical protein B0O80DRAFT_425533 [Mortierella sp. GBAus27b]|nr:hypothetical protein B0O80DRAFT_425533 [Mortierella sp. GBAus27b]
MPGDMLQSSVSVSAATSLNVVGWYARSHRQERKDVVSVPAKDPGHACLQHTKSVVFVSEPLSTLASEYRFAHRCDTGDITSPLQQISKICRPDEVWHRHSLHSPPPHIKIKHSFEDLVLVSLIAGRCCIGLRGLRLGHEDWKMLIYELSFTELISISADPTIHYSKPIQVAVFTR